MSIFLTDALAADEPRSQRPQQPMTPDSSRRLLRPEAYESEIRAAEHRYGIPDGVLYTALGHATFAPRPGSNQDGFGIWSDAPRHSINNAGQALGGNIHRFGSTSHGLAAYYLGPEYVPEPGQVPTNSAARGYAHGVLDDVSRAHHHIQSSTGSSSAGGRESLPHGWAGYRSPGIATGERPQSGIRDYSGAHTDPNVRITVHRDTPSERWHGSQLGPVYDPLPNLQSARSQAGWAGYKGPHERALADQIQLLNNLRNWGMTAGHDPGPSPADVRTQKVLQEVLGEVHDSMDPDMQARRMQAIGQAFPAMRHAASNAISRALGNGPIDPSVYRDDPWTHGAEGVSDLTGAFLPGVGPGIAGTQFAGLVGHASELNRQKGFGGMAGQLWHETNPFEPGLSTEDAVLRGLGLGLMGHDVAQGAGLGGAFSRMKGGVSGPGSGATFSRFTPARWENGYLGGTSEAMPGGPSPRGKLDANGGPIYRAPEKALGRRNGTRPPGGGNGNYTSGGRPPKSIVPSEVNFDRGNLLPSAYPSLSPLKSRVQSKITQHVISRAAPDIAKMVGGGLRVLRVTPSHGYWDGEENPNSIVHLTGDDAAKGVFADALGYVGEQGGTFLLTLGKGDQHAVFLLNREGGPISKEMFKEFADSHKDLDIGGTKTPQGYMIAGLKPERAVEIADNFRTWAANNGYHVKTARLQHEGRYFKHDWKADPEGNSYRSRISDAGRAGLLDELDNYRREYGSLLEDAFRRHAPGVLNPAERETRLNSLVKHPPRRE